MKNNAIYLLLIIILTTSVTIFLTNKRNTNEDLRLEISPISEEKAELITLYFPDKGRQYLVRENRIIAQKNEQKEKLILEELIKGPKKQKNGIVISPEVKINSIISRNDVTYIDLSSEFKYNMEFVSNSEILAIYSVVNSLTELKTIKNVKFTVDGQEEGFLQKYMPLDYIYTRNLELVNNPIQNPIEVVKKYFHCIQDDEYREAYDLLYKPESQNLDYSMYYHYQKDKNIEKHNIYTYKMVEDEDLRIVTFDYGEVNHNNEEIYYSNKEFKLKNYFGEWKIIIDDMP